MAEKLQVGQHLFFEDTNRGYKNQLRGENIRELEIVKIGKKFIYATGAGYRDIAIEKQTMQSKDLFPKRTFYIKKQEIFDFWEAIELKKKIKSAFDFYSKKEFSLQQLRNISAIIEQ